MKSNVYALTKEKSSLSEILKEAEKIAVYNDLSKKQALQLRLLAEELNGMLPELLEICEGSFWIESQGSKYELHTSVTALWMEDEVSNRLLEISTSGKNEAAKGIMGKIRMAAQFLLGGHTAPSDHMAMTTPFYTFYTMGTYQDPMYNSAWSLISYKNQAEDALGEAETSEEWDELEKSIIANLADDVVVGIKGDCVEIIIKKEFK